MANEKVNALLSLQHLNGLNTVYQNLSWDSVHDIQSSIVKVLDRSLIADVKKSHVFGLIADESTDLSIDKKIVVYVRFVKDGRAETKLIGNLKLESAKADGIVKTIVNKLQIIGLDCVKMVGFGSDGASVMMGKQAGVGKQLKDYNSPYMVHLHCLAHKLALACHDAIGEIDYLKTFTSRFGAIYSFYSVSTVRSDNLALIQQTLNDPILKMKQPIAIRWLSVKSAVEAMHRCYPSVLISLKEFSDQGNANAKSLLKYFKDFYNCALTAMMLDVHECITSLCLSLQSGTLTLAEVQPAANMCIGGLEALRDRPGAHLAKLYSDILQGSSDNVGLLKNAELSNYSDNTKIKVSSMQARYIASLIANLHSRFGCDSDNPTGEIINSLALLTSPSLIANSTVEQLQNSVTDVCNAFGTSKNVLKPVAATDGQITWTATPVPPPLSANNLQTEWIKAKSVILNSYKLLNPSQLCYRMISLHSDVLPNYAILCQIAFCMCVSSVECERGFSLQNRIKNKFRCSLKPESVDKLMKICQLGPSVESFTGMPAAIHLWLKQKARRKKRLAQPFKPRNDAKRVKF